MSAGIRWQAAGTSSQADWTCKTLCFEQLGCAGGRRQIKAADRWADVGDCQQGGQGEAAKASAGTEGFSASISQPTAAPAKALFVLKKSRLCLCCN